MLVFAMPQHDAISPVGIHIDDVQRRLATLLGSAVGKIRTTIDRRVSVIDVARAITGHDANYASQAVRNIYEEYPEVHGKITDFKFASEKSFGKR